MVKSGSTVIELKYVIDTDKRVLTLSHPNLGGVLGIDCGSVEMGEAWLKTVSVQPAPELLREASSLIAEIQALDGLVKSLVDKTTK